MPPDIAFKRLRRVGPALALGVAFGFAPGAPALAQSFFAGEAAAPSDERRPVRVIPTTQTPGALAPPAGRPAAAAPAAAPATGQGASAGRVSGAAPLGSFGGHSAFSPALSANNSSALAPPPRQSEGSGAVTGAASLLRPSPAPARAHFLRHLTNNIQGFRLAGEIAQSEWPMFLTEHQAQHRSSFKVSYLAAVSVMPEASYLTLIINDVQVGRTNVVGTRGVRSAVFDIPSGLLKPGFNSVRLTAEQRHRVDCSLEATYELWTQIDPTQTGLLLPRSDPGVTSLSELAALPVDEQGALPIRVITSSRASMASAERAIRAVQMISLLGRFTQPVVEFGAPAHGEHGINLAVGTIDEIRPHLDGAPLPPVFGPYVAVVPANAGRRTLIVVTGRTDADVNEALQQFAVAANSKGSPEGLRAAAAFPGYRIGGGERVRLRDLGLSSQEFSGRLFRAAFNLLLPPDFYSADYAKVTLDIAGGYSPGLGAGSQIIVSVNGRHVMSNKLTKASGDVFKQNPMQLPLGTFRPGLNRIEIEAQLPVKSDSACDPLAAIAGQKRFLFLDSTEIEMPQIARIARMPDLAVTATGAFPFAGGGAQPTLVTPEPSRESVGAAATLAAHLGIAAGRPIDFRLATQAPPAGAGPTLIVATAAAVDTGTLLSVGLNRDELMKIWRERIEAPVETVPETLPRSELLARHRLVLQRNFPASCHLPTPQGGFRRAERLAGLAAIDAVGTSAPPAAAPRAEVDLFAQWNDELRSGPWFFSRALSFVEGGVRSALTSVGALGDWARGEGGPPPAPLLSRQASLVVAQSIAGSSASDVRTLVVAADASGLHRAVACLVDPRVWRQVGGRIAALNSADAQIASVAADDPRLIATQPFSVQNTRLIVAGWFSLNSKVYVGVALLVALLLAFSTSSFIGNVGRRHDR